MNCTKCGSPKVIARGLCRTHYHQAWKSDSFGDAKTKSESTPVKNRLLAKIEKMQSGCWEWTGFRRLDDGFEYGLIWVNGKNRRAHRISYEVHIGKIPEGIDVLHKCDNPPCINPDHLFLGTRGENCTDAAGKNRFPLNARHHATKISAADVFVIRESSETDAALSARYGVVPSTISRIRSGARRSKAELG